MEEEKPSLSMSFEPNIIEHLGVKMYSHTVPALAELIANAYDACADKVDILLYNNPHKIVIKDNGVGMTFDEINEFYLRIGRNRRTENQDSCATRKATGKKGLGKLALFGLGNTFNIETVKNRERVSFTLDYPEIKESTGVYTPEFERTKVGADTPGTTITLTNLKKVQNYPIDKYAINIANLFNFPDSDFLISISLDDGEPILITSQTKYDSLGYQFKWALEEASGLFEHGYKLAPSMSGQLFSTEKPLKNNLKGVTLFANGRMVNEPEFFRGSESSHFYSYLTGFINVDFVDNLEEDLISTDRTSLDWNHDVTIKLRDYLSSLVASLERDWRKKRKELKSDVIKANSNIDVDKWLSTVPKHLKGHLDSILNSLETTEMPIAEQGQAIKNLHELIPEFPSLHWRHLHPEIQAASEKYYQADDYYQAFISGIKRYVANVRIKTGDTTSEESGLMGAAFGKGGKAILSVTNSKSKKPDGTSFAKQTLDSIEEGQKFISMGILSGCRNPLSHEETEDLKVSELFTEKDCLDALSILSHLHRRLEDV